MTISVIEWPKLGNIKYSTFHERKQERIKQMSSLLEQLADDRLFGKGISDESMLSMLRHAYLNLLSKGDKSLESLADGLIAPVIRGLEWRQKEL